MKRLVIFISTFFFWACASTLLFAQPQSEQAGNGDTVPPVFVRGQRELGLVVLDEASVGGGLLTFRTASGGCTNKDSFRINIRKRKGISETSPHYELTVERIARDDCKGLFLEGVVIAINLEKDVGLKGPYTVSVSNPVAPRPAGE